MPLQKSSAILLLFIMCVGCSVERQKREWGALQVMESKHRGTIGEDPIFETVDGCKGVGIRNLMGQEVWFLIYAKTEPYFKSMPPDIDISMTPKMAKLIISDSLCSKIVKEEVMRNSK